MYYSIALFFHILGALVFFIALGLEWTGLRQIRKATTSDRILEWMQISNSTRRVGMISMLTIFAAGIYMMATVWGAVSWILVALGALVLLVVLGMAVTGPRMAAISRAMIAEKGLVSLKIQNLANDPLLWISTQTRVAVALGIVFLMTIKPGLSISLLTVGIAVILGLASALPVPSRERTQERPG